MCCRGVPGDDAVVSTLPGEKPEGKQVPGWGRTYTPGAHTPHAAPARGEPVSPLQPEAAVPKGSPGRAPCLTSARLSLRPPVPAGGSQLGLVPPLLSHAAKLRPQWRGSGFWLPTRKLPQFLCRAEKGMPEAGKHPASAAPHRGSQSLPTVCQPEWPCQVLDKHSAILSLEAYTPAPPPPPPLKKRIVYGKEQIYTKILHIV